MLWYKMRHAKAGAPMLVNRGQLRPKSCFVEKVTHVINLIVGFRFLTPVVWTTDQDRSG